MIDLSPPNQTASHPLPRGHEQPPLLDKYLSYSIGYRGMCRFFSGPIYDHPKGEYICMISGGVDPFFPLLHSLGLTVFAMLAVRDLSYYMRLDVDSFLLRPFPYDPFRYLDDTGSTYGYLTTGEVNSIRF